MSQKCELLLTILLSVVYCAYSTDKIRWCVISEAEGTKCWAMADALKAAGINPEMECVRGANAPECMEMIQAGTAHLITLDGGDIYHAGSVFGMKPIMGEEYDYGRHYYAVAVIKTSDAGTLTFTNLQGKKSCHTGVRKTSGWNVPIGFMINSGILTVEDCQGDVKAASNFFSQSCAPGALNQDYRGNSNPLNLCELCIGDGTDKCARNSHEPYYNYDGAFRCLVEGGGDVAFVKHTTVQGVIDDAPDWASGQSATDYRLLCKDGATASVDMYTECNLAQVVGHGVMTSGSASANEIAVYKKFLNDAQNKFKDDALAGFRMFDSSDSKYGSGEKDLLFKDSTISLYSVDNTYEGYLGQAYVNTVKGLTQCQADSIRWCVVGDAEATKCYAMKEAFAANNMPKTVSCYRALDHGECMQLIKENRADAVTLDGGDIYKAGREYGLVPVAGETYTDDLQGTSYYAVVVVKKNTGFFIGDLKGKKSCHTGIQKTSGWNMPVGYLIETGQINPGPECNVEKGVGSFFRSSCVPGAKTPKYDIHGDNPDSLCQLCKGDGANKCARSADEPYYSYSGAFRCLVEDAGEVAFVKHTTVRDNTDGNNADGWAAALNSGDYELLCRDGTRKAVSEWASCNLARVPSHAVMARDDPTLTGDIWNLLNSAQQLFGPSSTGDFKLFSSADYPGSNLLFKDSTRSLVSAADKSTYTAWLGDEYLKALEALRCEGGAGGAASSPRGIAALSPAFLALLALLLTAVPYLLQ